MSNIPAQSSPSARTPGTRASVRVVGGALPKRVRAPKKNEVAS